MVVLEQGPDGRVMVQAELGVEESTREAMMGSVLLQAAGRTHERYRVSRRYRVRAGE